MMAWVQSWTMQTWAFGIGCFLVVLVTVTLLFGRETIVSWVEAVWKKRTGP